MPKFIGLQAGHSHIQDNCDPQLKGGTGAAPSNFVAEIDWTVQLRDHLKDILTAHGFLVQVDDANANCQNTTINKNFDFYLAIHYDANVYNTGGGFITAPDASVDAANAESLRIADCIRRAYFEPYTSDTGIVEHMERNNNNATLYYMWQFLSATTPCALIECGVGGDTHDDIILSDFNRCATAIAKGICKAFNVPFDQAPPQPAIDWQKKYTDEVAAHKITIDQLTNASDRISKIKSFVANG